MDIYILIVLLLLLSIFLFFTIRTYSLTMLGFFYVASWTLLSLMVCIIQGYYVSTLAFASHIVLAFSFFLPSMVFRNKKMDVKVVIYNIFLYSMLFNALGLLGLISHVSQFGFSLNFLELGKLASESRYSGESVSLLQVLGSSFLFVNSFIFGFLERLNRKLLTSILTTLTLIIMTAILTSSKASLLMSLAFSLSGYIVRNLLENKLILFSGKVNIAKKIIYILSSVIIFSVILQIIRYGGDSSMFKLAFDKIVIYSFGQFSAYSIWFDENNINILSDFPGYGILTGVFSKILGFERISGFYDDFTYISTDAYTNVFTLSRFLISDFTFVGSCVVLFFIGLLYEIFHIVKIPIGIKVLFFSLLSIEIIFGFSTSILSYNNVLLSLLLIMLFFQLNARVIRN
ncbi:oligosaccharide repeat unit polymerase [Vibrio vulnificus]|nr:oligosaccharide repeat unit polymerase [Vibrio vulnificus]EGQ9973426.1 oligosaccharide repeat unit polymerase [Vibrio vulnificus]EHK9044000.1 oligosaccharide repeat unit polymerase [Vibrio vulnificus]ELU2537059.1 oligosaccharide repeat unit polymerase [Vibrio vulnificus]RZP79397.1 oligosaccharide repeat unit polymerase [Vibrio vulnificus]